jgi:hypothetical protein
MTKMSNVFVALALIAATASGAAQDLSGRKVVSLGNAAGEQVTIGHVEFTPTSPGRYRFNFVLDESRFGEFFLAMRPFKCLTGPSQRLCHFPYGEENEVSLDDLTALEYRLMFLRTKPNAVHVDPRQGAYYRLTRSGNGLAGALFEVDMDPIITPQGDRRRPIRAKHLEPVDPATQWLPLLKIE